MTNRRAASALSDYYGTELAVSGLAHKGETTMNLNHKSQQAPFTKPNILVVEDELLLKAMLGEILREAGYSVTEAANGDDAWEIISEKCPDLVVTDVRMPGALDGIKLMEKIRTTNTTLPIIITSAHLVHVEDSSHGPTHFLPKPYEFDAVVELVKLELHK